MLATKAYAAIAEMASRLGVSGINKLTGCWEIQIDDQWWLALNGHDKEVFCTRHAKVPPFCAYIEFNGWPAGLINPRDGVIAAGGMANEDSFIKALEAKKK